MEFEARTCVVCGDTSEVKKHYGVDCCKFSNIYFNTNIPFLGYGCKAFFRRTINEEKKYTCSNEGTCLIDKSEF